MTQTATRIRGEREEENTTACIGDVLEKRFPTLKDYVKSQGSVADKRLGEEDSRKRISGNYSPDLAGFYCALDSALEGKRNVWIPNSRLLTLTGNKIVVTVPSLFSVDYIRSHFYDPMIETARMVLGPQIEGAEFIVNKEVYEGIVPKPEQQPLFTEEPIKTSPLARVRKLPLPQSAIDKMDIPYLGFPFAEHSGNADAIAMGKEIVGAVSQGKKSYTPYVFIGPGGVGKRHLLGRIMEALAHEGIGSLYRSVDELSGRLREAYEQSRKSPGDIETKKVFTPFFLNGEGLLVLSQFHLFGPRGNMRGGCASVVKPVIAQASRLRIPQLYSFDGGPEQFEQYLEKLRQDAPDLEGKLAHAERVFLRPPEDKINFLKKILGNGSTNVPEEETVAGYILSLISPSVLTGASGLGRMVSYARTIKGYVSRQSVPLNIESARTALGYSLQQQPQLFGINPQSVLEVVASRYGVRVDQILTDCRAQNVKNARQMVMRVLKTVGGFGPSEIGRVLGKDHSTISVALRRMGNEKLVGEEELVRGIREFKPD